MLHKKTISYWDGKQISSPAFFKNTRWEYLMYYIFFKQNINKLLVWLLLSEFEIYRIFVLIV